MSQELERGLAGDLRGVSTQMAFKSLGLNESSKGESYIELRRDPGVSPGGPVFTGQGDGEESAEETEKEEPVS